MSDYAVLVRLQCFRVSLRLRCFRVDARADVYIVVLEFDKCVNYILCSVSAVTAILFTFCPDCCCLSCEVT